ncbi:hypothetical protein [Paracidovorax sp. MALMAid1276]|uniref:hypothetical protein n=1 Tax=Paracidovorax sp. MALMAid1276 TaxID=3411631 RepID=UPI003B9D844A
MKILLSLIVFMAILGCNNSPVGKWEATERVEVYRNDDTFKVLFYIVPGEVCSLSLHWEVKKAAGYKKIICERGEGWIMDDRAFRRLDN